VSRAPHDALTRLLPGDDNRAHRLRLRRVLRKLQAQLPPGTQATVTPEGWEVHEPGERVSTMTVSEALEAIEARLRA